MRTDPGLVGPGSGEGRSVTMMGIAGALLRVLAQPSLIAICQRKQGRG